MDPGIYLPQFPGARKLDLRVEGVYTNLPGLKDQGYFYANEHYPQDTKGQILGSWIGDRVGRNGEQYLLVFGAQQGNGSLPQGDRGQVISEWREAGGYSGSITWMLRPRIELSATSQYETWKFPLLAAGARTNTATSFGIRYYPTTQLGSNTGHMNKQPETQDEMKIKKTKFRK